MWLLAIEITCLMLVCVCVCVCVCAQAHVCMKAVYMFMGTHGCQKSTLLFFPGAVHFVSWDRDCHRDPPSYFVRQSSSLTMWNSHSGARVAGQHSMDPLVSTPPILRLQSYAATRPFARRPGAKLRASCLHNKCLHNWVIFQLLMFFKKKWGLERWFSG